MAMDATTARKRFRAILAEEGCTSPASVFDPVSARLAEKVGFEINMLAGSMASMVVLGAPDWALLTLMELADLARRICRASSLPLLADADHGYGNALNAKRAVEELEAAGVAAITIEDTALPQPFGSKENGLIPSNEGAGKMRAALAGRSDSSLVIIARTNAAAIAGAEEAVARCAAYEATGVDALFLWGVSRREDLEAIASATRIPLMLARPGKDLRDGDFLTRNRVRLVLQGHTPYLAAIQRVYEVYEELRSGRPPSEIERLPPQDLMRTLLRSPDYQAWREAFLTDTSA